MKQAMDAKEAISVCAKDPEQLRGLAPSQFEAVVAELLAGFGWQVSVTPQTQDGGYDILGVTTDPSGLQTSWIVECQRYSPDNKVGMQVARQIVYVKGHIGVPNAVLVTTSSFTAEVHELSSARHDLHLVDLATLTGWLQRYSPLPGSSHTAARSFLSCFVSYSSRDEAFAQKLTARLRTEGVPVWYAPEDIQPGEKIYDQVKKAIASFDRLLVVLSAHSMNSSWVKTELANALAREHREGVRVLFPIALAPIDAIRAWECMDPDSGIDIARELRAYHIPDFSNWSDRRNLRGKPPRLSRRYKVAGTIILNHLQPLKRSSPQQLATDSRKNSCPQPTRYGLLSWTLEKSYLSPCSSTIFSCRQNTIRFLKNTARQPVWLPQSVTSLLQMPFAPQMRLKTTVIISARFYGSISSSIERSLAD